MNIGSPICWIEAVEAIKPAQRKLRSSGICVRSGEIVTVKASGSGRRAYQVRVEAISGNFPDIVLETVWLRESEYRLGRAETWQHLGNRATPFEVVARRLAKAHDQMNAMRQRLLRRDRAAGRARDTARAAPRSPSNLLK